MVASGCELEDGKGGRVCYNNILYLNWCLVEAGLPLPGKHLFRQNPFFSFSHCGTSFTSFKKPPSRSLLIEHTRFVGILALALAFVCDRCYTNFICTAMKG